MSGHDGIIDHLHKYTVNCMLYRISGARRMIARHVTVQLLYNRCCLSPALNGCSAHLKILVVVVVVVFTLKTVLTSIQYPSLSYSSGQRNEFPGSQANPKQGTEK